MTRPASGPGRLLERIGDDAPRGMTAHDRTRLIGRLRHFSMAFAMETPKFACANLGPRSFIQILSAVPRPPLLKGGCGKRVPSLVWRPHLLRCSRVGWLNRADGGSGGPGGQISKFETK